jgi:hypothetical protein
MPAVLGFQLRALDWLDRHQEVAIMQIYNSGDRKYNETIAFSGNLNCTAVILTLKKVLKYSHGKM